MKDRTPNDLKFNKRDNRSAHRGALSWSKFTYASQTSQVQDCKKRTVRNEVQYFERTTLSAEKTNWDKTEVQKIVTIHVPQKWNLSSSVTVFSVKRERTVF